MNSPYERLLKYFNYEHLPKNLQLVSKPFHDLAHKIVNEIETDDIAEKITALRKLLESKDCAVRSMVK